MFPFFGKKNPVSFAYLGTKGFTSKASKFDISAVNKKTTHFTFLISYNNNLLSISYGFSFVCMYFPSIHINVFAVPLFIRGLSEAMRKKWLEWQVLWSNDGFRNKKFRFWEDFPYVASEFLLQFYWTWWNVRNCWENSLFSGK